MHRMGNLMLASTQVNHSQKMNEKPLTLWVIALESGKILAAHCDSAAGTGETYSYVASLLWVIGVRAEARIRWSLRRVHIGLCHLQSGRFLMHHWRIPTSLGRGSHANLEQLVVVPHLRSQFPKRRRVNRCSFSIPWPHVQELSRSTGRYSWLLWCIRSCVSCSWVTYGTLRSLPAR